MRTMLGVAAALAALALPGAARASDVFLVEGRGWGHGIGLGQYGADGFARAGWGHERILRHYYRGTSLATLPDRTVRVLLLEGRKRVRIGKRVWKAEAVERRGGEVRFRARGRPWGVNGNAYRGSVVLRLVDGTIQVVNEVSLERYLRGVVPWEMPDDWHPEALKAQAVVARSYALATLKPGLHYDLYADVRSQVYGGVRAESETTNAAIAATRGLVVMHGGAVAATFYHSTSGGRTADVEDVWPKAGAVPYLRSVADPWDARSKHHRWQVRMRPGLLARRLGMGGVLELAIVRRGGRVSQVRVRGPKRWLVFDGSDFRRRLDLRSTWFTVKRDPA